MFGISLEHLLILAAILLFFGPGRIGGIGRSLRKTAQNFKDGLEGVKEASFKRIEPKDGEDEKNQEKK